MRLPDPFTPNLKVDVLQEISLAPKISPDFQCYIQPPSFKKVILMFSGENHVWKIIFVVFNCNRI